MNTKALILDTAEKLFAQDGFDAVSLRDIVAAAEVNLAAVNYHFGSKEGLIRAVLLRRIQPLTEERLRLLDQYEKEAAGGGPVALPRILDALIGPALRLSHDGARGGRVFVRLLGRIFSDPGEDWQRMLEEMFGETAARFTAALRKTLPQLPDKDLFWRIHFMVGAMAHSMADPDRACRFSGGVCDPNDQDELLRQLIQFLTGGFEAAACKGGAKQKRRTKA